MSAGPLLYRQNVGIMLLNEAGEVLAGERCNMRNAWQMPQGGIDEGEAPDVAALRELAEETGITAAQIIRPSRQKFRYDFPRLSEADKWRGQEQLWFAMRFTGNLADIDVTAVTHPEFSAHAWLSADEMLRRIVAFKRPVYADVFTDFAELIKRSAQ